MEKKKEKHIRDRVSDNMLVRWVLKQGYRQMGQKSMQKREIPAFNKLNCMPERNFDKYRKKYY